MPALQRMHWKKKHLVRNFSQVKMRVRIIGIPWGEDIQLIQCTTLEAVHIQRQETRIGMCHYVYMAHKRIYRTIGQLNLEVFGEINLMILFQAMKDFQLINLWQHSTPVETTPICPCNNWQECPLALLEGLKSIIFLAGVLFKNIVIQYLSQGGKGTMMNP